MTPSSAETQAVWKEPFRVWLVLLVIAALMGFAFYDGLKVTVEAWSQPEYSHGYLIPFIVIFLIWQRKDRLEQVPFVGSWIGILVMVLGVLLLFAGKLSTHYSIIEYSFVIVLMGIVLAMMGWRAFKIIWAPLIMLLFMFPIPVFLFATLSTQLQLISSQLGVAIIRLFNISVYLEGNVIDLGVFKLQVVEACSGLRYLFPLMTLGFIMAYFFKAAFWKRAVVFLSTIPITVFMNSFRVGMIGILVDHWGRSMAMGFLHYFEGWVVFMVCLGILVLEMWALSRMGESHKPLREVFGLEMPAPTPSDALVKRRAMPRQLPMAAAVMVVAAVVVVLIGQRTEIIPARSDFLSFPMQIEQWKGQREQMNPIYIDVLKFDDYILADYTDGKNLVNLYVAYYNSQSKGDTPHSPRSCIPGGGWQIKDFSQRTLQSISVNGVPLRVNRVQIEQDDVKQLVYYWFQERGRIITNEYLVKWYLFWDALTRNRSDGALVRLVTFVPPGTTVESADQRLTGFAGQIAGPLKKYIPD
ncbi:MAG: VPLPA-CTERM-specific exosortase XrtD [Sulfuricaulis sp.]